MLSALVPFQITKLTKSFIAHIAFIRFLVRVNTHVVFQSTRVTKTLLAHIALVLLRSLPLHSFLINSRFFFSYLMMMIHLEILLLLLRNPRAHKHHRGSSFTRPSKPSTSRSPLFSDVDIFLRLFAVFILVVVVVIIRSSSSRSRTKTSL